MLIVGNWKMNGGLAAAGELAAAVAAAPVEGVEVVVCPPFVHLPRVAGALRGTPVGLGAQNVADQDQGAFTGEVSAAMLAEFGCRFAIVGHSERRALYHEDRELVAARFAAARRQGLTPILCVGETLEQRDPDATAAVLREQVEAVFATCGDAAFAGAVVAYEPVWAIGTGRTASPEQAQAAHAGIRAVIAERDGDAARALRILYGGSMKPDSAPGLPAMADVDGGLIGGAAHDADSFIAIARAAAA